MIIRDVCPRCKAPKYKKHGHMHKGKQHHHGHECGRQFVQGFAHHLLSENTRALSERVLVERISWRGMGRAVGVGLKWFLGLLVHGVEALPEHLPLQPVTCQHNVLIPRLDAEAEAMSRFVQKKANKQWIWMAMDAPTRQVMACYVGDRRRKSAKRLWAKVPVAYRQHGLFYTDQ
jgi:insertion element IS1 protein InsB